MRRKKPTAGFGPPRPADRSTTTIFVEPAPDSPPHGPPSTAVRERLPDRRGSLRFSIQHEGTTYFVTVSKFGDGRIAELFLDAANKPDSQLAAHANTAAMLCSLLLQHGVSVASIRHSVRGPVAVALEQAEREP